MASRNAFAVPALLVSRRRPNLQVINNTNSTTQQREANHCDVKVTRTLWFPVQPTAKETFLIRATTAAVATVMALYRADDYLTAAACSVGDTLSLAEVKADESFVLVVRRANSTGGNIPLEFQFGTPSAQLSRDVPPSVIDQPSDGNLTLRAFELGLVPEPAVTWLRDGKLILGSTGSTFNIATLTPVEAGRYSVILDKGLSRVTNLVADVALDLPWVADHANAEVRDGLFRIHLTGNAKQRVAMERLDTLAAVRDRQEDWLGENGLSYEDAGPLQVPWRF